MRANGLPALLIALVLLMPASARAVVQATPDNAAPSADAAYPLLDRIFKAELLPEQLAGLGPEASVERAAAALTQEQKTSTFLALRRLEPTASASDMKQIKRGYELLGFWDEAVRVQALPPRVESAALADATTALAQGDKAKAALLASEILARDPLNKEAHGILKLSERYMPEAELEQIKLNPTAPQDVKVLGYMLQAGNARGDHYKLLRLAMDAMRADPTSPLAHEFYNVVNTQRAEHLAKVLESYNYVQEAKRALVRGDKNTALVWAQKAADADDTAATRGYLESVRVADPSKRATLTAQPIATLPQQQDKSPPFWPLAGAAVAVLALGGAAVAWGDRAVMWFKEHPYLALGGVSVAAFAAGWLVFGSGAAGGLTLITTNGARIVAGARASSAAKPAVDGAVTLLVAKGAADTLSAAKAEDRSQVAVQSGRPGRLVRGNSDDPYKPVVPGPGVVPPLIPGQLPTSSKPKQCDLKPGEDILSRFIDETGLAPGFLNKHEGPAKGHTIEKHVKKSRAYLLNRIRAEGRIEASSFHDYETAEEITRNNILGHKAAIQSWYLGPSLADRFVHYPGTHERPIGYSVTVSNESTMLPKYGATTRLSKMGCQILILTSFPD